MAKYFSPEIETASRDYLHAIQSARLIKTVKRCYENIPFYKAKFDEIGLKPEDIHSIDDISKLPFTVKQDLRDHYPFGLFAVPRDELVRVHASSGTTGKQTVVGYTRGDIDRWSECVARALTAAGTTPSDYIHVSYGYGLFTGGMGIHYGAEKLGATAIPVSSGNTKRQVQILQDFGSNVLCCTPSYALFIAETLKEMNVDPAELPLRIGIFGAEPWSENMRTQLENMLKIKAYDIYGLSEIAGPGVAFECCEQSGMHICEDYFYPEIVDPVTLKPLPDGEYGELAAHSFTAEKAEAQYLKSAATCTEKAVYYKSCAVCELSSKGTDGEATFEAGKPLGHNWGAWTQNSDEKTHTRICKRDASHTETENCHGGTATCTHKAVCAVCGGEYGELDPKNHTNLKHFPATAATKTTEGNIEYWYCSGCKKYYKDATATQEIKQADTVTAKLPGGTVKPGADKSPQTGDNSNLLLWIALLFVSGGAAIGTTVVSRKRKYNK